jgi:uncharacterized protein (DUF302 family)
MPPAGFVSHLSQFDSEQTAARAVTAVAERGMSILARIDHAAAAAQAGLALRPTEVLIFGNAKAGTPLMQTSQTLGIDLPLRILVWQDETGRTWLGYNDPAWLTQRHGINAGQSRVVDAMTQALTAIARQATGQSRESS